MTIIAYSPLAQGLLTGKYGPPARPGGVRRWSTRSRIHRVPAVVERLTAIGVSRQAGPEQVALAWLVAKGAVPIPGAKTAAQAGANAGAVQGPAHCRRGRRSRPSGRLRRPAHCPPEAHCPPPRRTPHPRGALPTLHDGWAVAFGGWQRRSWSHECTGRPSCPGQANLRR